MPQHRSDKEGVRTHERAFDGMVQPKAQAERKHIIGTRIARIGPPIGYYPKGGETPDKAQSQSQERE